jgi:hypothetical protein
MLCCLDFIKIFVRNYNKQLLLRLFAKRKLWIFLIIDFIKTLTMKKIIFLLAFVVSIVQLRAQDSTASSGGRKWQKSSVGLITGYYYESPYHAKYNPAPETNYLKSNQDLLPFHHKDFNGSDDYAGGTFINPFISFNPWNKKDKAFNKNQELRIGIIYYGNSGRDFNYENKYDGSVHGDTTIISSVSFKNQRDDLGMSIGYTLRSSEWYRFSLYSGVNLGITYSFTHSVLQKTTETTFDSLRTNTYYNNYYSARYSNDQYKELKGLPSLSVRGQILGGANLRIVNPVVLFMEGRIGYSYIQPIGGVASMQTHLNINVGFKFRI